MMRYRAKLTEPGNSTAERPVEIFGMNRAVVDEWTLKVLKKSTDSEAFVEVFETVEARIAIILKPREPAEVPEGAPKP